MPKIQRLPPEVVNRIAAGEVIERPASVVKELVENAIDADATEVLLDVEEGGIKRLTVRDNGSGMAPEDMALAFESHATSKLATDDFESSLFGIRTLGFRGEALPSIASVADVEVVSRTPESDCAYRMSLQSGRVTTEPQPTAGEIGTVVEVRELFHNVPARRKFLRTPNAELSRIVQQVTRIALACPSIRFLVTHGTRRSLDLPAAEGVRERLLQIVGKDKAREFLEVSQRSATADGENDGPSLSGFISSPKLRRGDARMQHFFVNGRWVRDRMLSAALRSAYQGFLIPGNHPVAYLFLEFPSDAVDVNVHPQKSEVRFRDPGMLYPLVYNAVRRALELEKEERAPENEPREEAIGEAAQERVRQAALDFLSRPEPVRRPFTRAAGAVTVGRGREYTAESRRGAQGKQEERYRESSSEPSSEPSSEAQRETETRQEPAGSPPSRAFQVLESYIVVEDGDGLTLIDQHALHEKILFEDIFARLLEGHIVQQKLLVPEVVTLPLEHVPLIEEGCELLARCGYEVAPFGDNDIAIQAVPDIFERRCGSSSSTEIVQAVFRWLFEEGERTTPKNGGGSDADDANDVEKPELLQQRLRELASMMACKRAVKAGASLSLEEIDSLLERADLADDPRHCPHGRPTTVRLSVKEIERKFDRK